MKRIPIPNAERAPLLIEQSCSSQAQHPTVPSLSSHMSEAARRWPCLKRAWLTFVFVLVALVGQVYGDSAQNDQRPGPRLTHVSLEDLGNIEVTTASKEPVAVSKTPAAIYVITAEDIRRSGATSIPEVLRL